MILYFQSNKVTGESYILLNHIPNPMREMFKAFIADGNLIPQSTNTGEIRIAQNDYYEFAKQYQPPQISKDLAVFAPVIDQDEFDYYLSELKEKARKLKR